MSYRFDSCTGIAVVQVPSDSLAHARPPVVSANKLIGGSASRVSCCRVVMMLIDNFPVKGLIVWDVEEAINVQEVIVDRALA